MADSGNAVRYFKWLRDFLYSFVHVYAMGNMKGRFIKVKMPSFGIACNGVYLKSLNKIMVEGGAASLRT